MFEKSDIDEHRSYWSTWWL